MGNGLHQTGTWLSRDPLGFVDGPNLYAYVNANPWSKFDPEGLSAWSKTRAITGAVIGSIADTVAAVPIAIINTGPGANVPYNPVDRAFGYQDNLAQEFGYEESPIRVSEAQSAELSQGVENLIVAAGSAQISPSLRSGSSNAVLPPRNIVNGAPTTQVGAPASIAPKSPGQKGREGEAAASKLTGAQKNTKTFKVNGRDRIPDQVLAQDVNTRLPTHIVEVKNVKKQSRTRQLRDDVDLVGASGKVDVYMPKGAKVTKPLQRDFDDPANPLNRQDLD